MIKKKTMKNAFYFTGKASSVLEVFKFLHFPLPLIPPSSTVVEFIGEADLI